MSGLECFRRASPRALFCARTSSSSPFSASKSGAGSLYSHRHSDTRTAQFMPQHTTHQKAQLCVMLKYCATA